MDVLKQMKCFKFHPVNIRPCRHDQQPDGGISSAVNASQCVQHLKTVFPLSYEISNTVNNVLMNTDFQFVFCKPDSYILWLGPVSQLLLFA
jgi:hypothetical protein